jgi:DNA-binding GntR family transcriptional regulator
MPLTNDVRQLSSRLTLTGEVYEIIRSRILNLELPPGTWLKDSDLAYALGTSNTPVRESLRRLEAEGLVETIPRRGTFVRRLSQPEVEGLYEVREALEILAVRLAAQRANDALLEEVVSVAERHLQAVQHGDINEYLEHDRRFHDLIAVGSENSTLTSILRRLADRIHIVRRMDLGRRQDELSGREHLDIAAALMRRDGEAAAHLMESHIRVHRGRVLDTLSQ